MPGWARVFDRVSPSKKARVKFAPEVPNALLSGWPRVENRPNGNPIHGLRQFLPNLLSISHPQQDRTYTPNFTSELPILSDPNPLPLNTLRGTRTIPNNKHKKTQLQTNSPAHQASLRRSFVPFILKSQFEKVGFAHTPIAAGLMCPIQIFPFSTPGIRTPTKVLPVHGSKVTAPCDSGF
ncbi:15201_t:CDS:2 [Acaulospora morrowiae]|uniref:15201_t:CDS:1 n=1 Tax=Acaulospora morrowiae TaxID=94023 RepID=A0A9N9G0D4_9GLOM|nr:15201_t:CDS:2 [Acaulospora morrowiae]